MLGLFGLKAGAYHALAKGSAMPVVGCAYRKVIRTGRVNVPGTGRDAVAGAYARPAGRSVPTAGARRRALAGVRPLVGTVMEPPRMGRETCADRVQGR